MRWKSKFAAVALTALTALTIGGCAQEAEPPQRPEAGSGQPELSRERPADLPGRKPIVKPVPPPSDGDEGGKLPKTRIEAQDLPASYPVDVRTLDGGRTLRITAEEGGCDKASAELVEETAAAVTVRLVTTKPADPQTICTMDIRYPPLDVELAEPLGERDVVLQHAERTR